MADTTTEWVLDEAIRAVDTADDEALCEAIGNLTLDDAFKLLDACRRIIENLPIAE